MRTHPTAKLGLAGLASVESIEQRTTLRGPGRPQRVAGDGPPLVAPQP